MKFLQRDPSFELITLVQLEDRYIDSITSFIINSFRLTVLMIHPYYIVFRNDIHTFSTLLSSRSRILFKFNEGDDNKIVGMRRFLKDSDQARVPAALNLAVKLDFKPS